MSLKKIIFWEHLRGTWQYDVFCLLIIAFIFLTPKTWFDKHETLATQTSRLIVKADDFSDDERVLAGRVKQLSGNPNAEIVSWRQKKNEKGDIFYEIDLR
ncbi:MAG: hypothetical protein R2747_08710 [Pyrinomonadaceae bacterium]